MDNVSEDLQRIGIKKWPLKSSNMKLGEKSWRKLRLQSVCRALEQEQAYYQWIVYLISGDHLMESFSYEIIILILVYFTYFVSIVQIAQLPTTAWLIKPRVFSLDFFFRITKEPDQENGMNIFIIKLNKNILISVRSETSKL